MPVVQGCLGSSLCWNSIIHVVYVKHIQLPCIHVKQASCVGKDIYFLSLLREFSKKNTFSSPDPKDPQKQPTGILVVGPEPIVINLNGVTWALIKWPL